MRYPLFSTERPASKFLQNRTGPAGVRRIAERPIQIHALMLGNMLHQGIPGLLRRSPGGFGGIPRVILPFIAWGLERVQQHIELRYQTCVFIGQTNTLGAFFSIHEELLLLALDGATQH
jgi:hypothetical protein